MNESLKKLQAEIKGPFLLDEFSIADLRSYYEVVLFKEFVGIREIDFPILFSWLESVEYFNPLMTELT